MAKRIGIWAALLAVALVMAGCSVGQVREAITETQGAIAYADVQVESFSGLVADLEMELATLPDGEPGKEETIILLNKAAEALDYWTERRGLLDEQLTALNDRMADLAADDDATLILGQSAAEIAAMAGVPGAAIVAAILGGISQRRRMGAQAGNAIAMARAASPEFNAAFDQPQVSGVLKGALPSEVQSAGKAANWKIGVKTNA